MKRITQFVLVAAALTLTFQLYWLYSVAWRGQDYVQMDLVHGTAGAPEQYRIGVVMLAYWGMRYLHFRMRYGYTAINAISSIAAVLVLYHLLRRGDVFRKSPAAVQWLGSAALCMLVLYELAWDAWYERPSTLAIALLTVLLLWLWTHSDRSDAPTNPVWRAAAIPVVSLLQSLVRADLTVCLGAGIFVIAWTQYGRRLALSRKPALAVSFLSMLTGAGTQLYLTKIAYPAATYGDIPRVMILHEHFTPLLLFPFLAFMAPFAWLCIRLYRTRFRGNAAALGFTVAALLYVPIWLILGKLDEVRIFLPLAIALIPLTVEQLMLDVGGSTS